MNKAVKSISFLRGYIWNIGNRPALGSYEKRKLGIFNFMNLLGLLTGVLVPAAALVSARHRLPLLLMAAGCLPAVVSVVALTLNHFEKYEPARLLFFTAYPVITGLLIYVLRIDVGLEFFFVLYAVLSVFFLGNIYNIIFSFSLSMLCYLLVYDHSHPLFHVLAMSLIFFGLLLIKNENTRYQEQSRDRNWQLRRSNLKILRQKADITGKAALLEEQTQQLTELNSLKNKLFSVIAHDLKAPLYALRNLFRNVQLYDLPGEEIKQLVPEVINELTYTTGLMENMLQWAKSQMHSETVRPQLLDIAGIAREVLQLLRLQAEAKQIYINSRIEQPIFVYADKDMVNLVLRNLLSNAIKFTPPRGRVTVRLRPDGNHVVISVADTGIGIAPNDLANLGSPFFQAGASYDRPYEGTGLGLSVVRGLVGLHGGTIAVESELNHGTCVSVRLPLDCRRLPASKTGTAKIETLPRRSRSDDPRLFSNEMMVKKIA
jgi:signal transduction histidine kinase